MRLCPIRRTAPPFRRTAATPGGGSVERLGEDPGQAQVAVHDLERALAHAYGPDGQLGVGGRRRHGRGRRRRRPGAPREPFADERMRLARDDGVGGVAEHRRIAEARRRLEVDPGFREPPGEPLVEAAVSPEEEDVPLRGALERHGEELERAQGVERPGADEETARGDDVVAVQARFRHVGRDVGRGLDAADGA
jgi:hypothetical protein